MARKPASSRQTSSATAILSRVAGRGARLHRLIEEERSNLSVARAIHDARSERGLSQAQLARLVGTTQSVIARLEDADYRGHSMTMLRRIGAALGYDVQVQFVKPGRVA